MKFYHGTSTIFIDSIKMKGLGTINPNIEFKHLDLLESLFELAENNLRVIIEYQKIRTTTNAMVLQASFNSINEKGEEMLLHYRHHNIHVSLSRLRAVRYACINEFGSEILQRCVTIYKLLIKHKIKFEISSNLNISRIDLAIKSNPFPILVEISDINRSNLIKEGGTSAIEELKNVESSFAKWTEHERDYYTQYMNFEILKPIGIDKLKFYSIEFAGNAKGENFEYTLSKF